MVGKLLKYYILPIATLTGGIIGVGFLSLPYIALQVGLPLMLCYFVAMTALLVTIHVIFGKISLKTPDHKRWPGFVGFYLGSFAKKIILATETLGLFGVLLVYLIIGGQFLSTIFGPFLGGGSTVYVLFYFAVASIFIYAGTSLISKIDFLAISSLLIIAVVILVKGFSHIRLEYLLNQPFVASPKTLFLPYGAIMFALWGAGLIPEVEEMVPQSKKSLKSIIIIGTLIAAVFYTLFTIIILGITGPATTPSALTGLANLLPPNIIMVALLIGVITTFIAFIAHGLLLKKMLMYDAGVKEFYAWVLVCFVPLILFLMGLHSFIDLISFIGGFLLGIDGILILWIYKKIGGKSAVAYPLMLVFLAGMAYEIIYFVK